MMLESHDKCVQFQSGWIHVAAVKWLGDRVLSWASILDDGTRAQAERAASMPFVHPYLALMPDAHLGQGATVGSMPPAASLRRRKCDSSTADRPSSSARTPQGGYAPR